jgi:hypothetical protein
MNLKSVVLLFNALFAGAVGLDAQRGVPPQPPQTPRAAAPIDLAGFWVSLVTNEWRWRMLPPTKGDYAVLPLNAEGRRIADTWDPARDEASGNQCRSYGAAVILQVPGRLRIAWEKDDVLRMDIDAGTQTRLFQFGQIVAPGDQPTWQGQSAAQWQVARGQGREGQGPRSQARNGTLKVVTTRMRPGYLRKNGAPYSGDAVVTEYMSRLSDRGADYLNVTAIVEDPQYLTGPYVRSMQFKREADGSKWNPSPCSTN